MKWARAACAWIAALPLAAAPKTHELCAPCHSEQVQDFQNHAHFRKGLSCDICHGASVRHRTASGAAAPDRVAAPDVEAALCGACHTVEAGEYKTTRHAQLVEARGALKGASCTTCHGVHAPRSDAQMVRQCNRCHTALSATHPKVEKSCNACHARHTLKTAPHA